MSEQHSFQDMLAMFNSWLVYNRAILSYLILSGRKCVVRYQTMMPAMLHAHDDVVKWKNIPRFWPFVVRGIRRSPVNSSHKGQWRRPLTFSLICTWINGWVNNRETGDLRRHRAHHDVIVMTSHHTNYHLSSLVRQNTVRSGPTTHANREMGRLNFGFGFA